MNFSAAIASSTICLESEAQLRHMEGGKDAKAAGQQKAKIRSQQREFFPLRQLEKQPKGPVLAFVERKWTLSSPSNASQRR